MINLKSFWCVNKIGKQNFFLLIIQQVLVKCCKFEDQIINQVLWFVYIKFIFLECVELGELMNK